ARDPPARPPSRESAGGSHRSRGGPRPVSPPATHHKYPAQAGTSRGRDPRPPHDDRSTRAPSPRTSASRRDVGSWRPPPSGSAPERPGGRRRRRATLRLRDSTRTTTRTTG